MVVENIKLPIPEEQQCFLTEKKLPIFWKKNLSVMTIFAAILILIIILLLSVIYLVCEIDHLKKDVHILNVEYKRMDVYLANVERRIEKYSDIEPDIADYIDENDDYNYEYEMDNEDDEDVSDEDNNHHLITGGNLTKDFKDRIRNKRNIIGYTDDGVPINSESYAEARRKNLTSKHNIHHHLRYQSVENIGRRSNEEITSHSTSTPRPIYSRRSRVMLQDDKSKAFRQFVKKSALKSGDIKTESQEDSEVEFTIVRNDGGRIRHHQRQIEGFDERPARFGRIRPLPTAHFHGDTSKYVLGVHDNFNGDGHLRHPQKTYVDWLESSWFRTLGMDRHFSFDDGVLTIKDSGLYFVYAQIYYYDEHDINGFMVYKNNKILLQCTTMTHSMKRVMKGNTCYTAAAEYLQEGDRITLGDISESRYSMFEPGKSFFGVIKLGDVKIK